MKEDMEDYPVLSREDCPNGIIKWLGAKMKERDHALSDQLHEYHMEVLDVKQKVVNHSMMLKIGGLAIIIVVVIILVGWV